MSFRSDRSIGAARKDDFSVGRKDVELKPEQSTSTAPRPRSRSQKQVTEMTSTGSGVLAVQIHPSESRVAAGGVRHPRMKQLKVAKATPLRLQRHGVALKEARTTGAQPSAALAKPDVCKGKPAQGQATSLVRVQVPQKMGIVGKLGTTAPISFSKRRSANAPSVTTLPDRPPPAPSPAAIKPKGQLVGKRRKISSASSHFSDAASPKTEGISHTTLQDTYVSRMKEQLEGNTALPFSSPSLGQRGRHDSGQTAADVLSAVSSATLSMASLDNTSVGGPKAQGTSTPLKGASLSQSTIGCAAEAQEHYSARATSSTSLTSFASSSKLPRLSAASSGLASHSSVTHSRVTSARQSIQGDSQLQSNSLKLEVDLSHLQMIGPEQNESRPFSAASGSLPGAELEGSGSGRHLLNTPTQAGADMHCSSEFGVEEDQASRKDTEEFEGNLKRIHYGDSVTSHGSASTQSTSVESSTFALPMINREKKQLGIAEPSLSNYEGGLATVTDYLPGDADAGLLKQFFMSDVEGTQTLSKLPRSMMEGSVGHQSPSGAFTPPLHCAEHGGESLQAWNYPIVLPRPSSEADSSSASTSEVYPGNDARSHSSASSDPTSASLTAGSARFANSSRDSPVSLHSSGTGQLLAALLSPTDPYSAFHSPGHSHTLSSELAQLSSAHLGSMTMPSSIAELDRCPSSTHSASQVQELLPALSPASPVLLGESRMPSYQEVDLTNPPEGPALSAQASSCSLTASSAASCGSHLSSGGLQVGPYTTARGHHREGSEGSNDSSGAADPSQATELPTQDIGVREQVGAEVSGPPDVNNLPSFSPSLPDPVELVPHAVSIQPGGSVDVDPETILIGSQTPMGCPQESENSSGSTLVRSEGASSPGEVPSLGRRPDQDKRPTALPPTTLQLEEADPCVSGGLAAVVVQGQDEGPLCSPQEESDGGGSLTPDGRQVGAECSEGQSQDTPSQGTPFTESHSVTCTDSSVTVGECTAGGSHFGQESELLHTELRREGVGKTADKKAKGITASSGGHLTTSDILERNKAYSKSSLAEYLLHTEGPVTLSDIMNIEGHALSSHQPVPVPPVTDTTHSHAKDTTPRDVGQEGKLVLLSTSSSTELTQGSTTLGGIAADSHGRHNIHHFCAAPPVPQLSAQLQALSVKTHTAIIEPSTTDTIKDHNIHPNLPSGLTHPMLPVPTPCRTSLQVDQLLGPFKAPSKLEPVKSVDVFKTGRPPTVTHKGAVEVVRPLTGGGIGGGSSELSVQGVKLQTECNDLSLIWQPAPPKFGLHPSTVRSYLFPSYQGLPREERRRREEGLATRESEGTQKRLRDINRAFQSLSDLSSAKQQQFIPHPVRETLHLCTPAAVAEPKGLQYSGSSDSEVEEGGGDGVEGEATALQAPTAVGHTSGTTTGGPDGDQPPHGLSLKLPLHSLKKQSQLVHSSPLMTEREPSSPSPSMVEESFGAIMDEVKFQRKQLLLLHSSDTVTDLEDYSDTASSFGRGSRIRLLRAGRNAYQRRSIGRPGGAAGRRKAPRKRTKSAEMRASHARKKLAGAPFPLQRSTSFPLMLAELQQLSRDSPDAPQLSSQRQRRPSEPSQLDFEAFLKEQGTDPSAVDHREWANGRWDKWFDEVYAEYRAVWEAYKREMAGHFLFGQEHPSLLTALGKQEVMKAGTEEEEGREEGKEQFPELENIDLIITEDTESKAKSMQCEIERLDSSIAGGLPVDTLPIHLCRRGALLRKVGKLKAAKEDLDRSVQLQPKLADSYWQRHLLSLIQGNTQAALDDLEKVLALNSTHILALQSKAALLQKQGSVKAAVVLLDVAVTASSSDPSLYMFRAALNEELGESALAVQDYTRAAQLDQSNTRGLMKQGLHCYNSNHLPDAMSAFTQLLQRDPNSSEARIYRARVEWKMGDYPGALKDLSAVIHLSPDNSQAFFLRGCLLRKTDPKRALKDFSISLLLDDSANNAPAVLHRGILYSEMGRFDDAVADFSEALRLVPSMACAHINIGLVHLKRFRNPERAITSFSQGLKVDPTYVRGYLCRAEALVAVGEPKTALRDLTSAIHLKPDEPSYYLRKGCIHVQLAEYDVAETYVRTASAMSGGALGHQPLQDAAVASFLGNLQEAMDLLSKVLETSPSPAMWYLLGRIHQKANQHLDAMKAFQAALKSLKSTAFSYENTPSFRSDCFHGYGVSLFELRETSQALTLFNKAIKANRRNSQAYYYCSLCKLALHGTRQALPDINKALEIEPNQFEVSLTRATMLAEQGRFKKALFNCSKAAQLQPLSARTHMYSGCFRMHLGKHEEALEDFNTATRLCPSSPVVFYNRALCHQALGNSAQAIDDYTKALETSREPSLQILVNRGLLFLDTKDYTRALEDIIAAGQLSPQDATLFQAIGLCYHKLGELEQATAAYSQAVALDPLFWEAIIGRGNAHLESLTPEGAQRSMRDYARVLHISPLNTPARINLAYLLQMEGKLRQAWEHFSLVLSIDPLCWQALEGRSIVSLQAGYLDGALKDISDAIKVSMTAELLNNRGVIHEYLEDRVNAARDYSEAIRVNPTFNLAHFNIGNMYFHHRQFAQAVSSYSCALELCPQDESSLVNRAICKVIQGDTAAALADLTAAAGVNPYAAHIYYNRGNLYKALGQFVEAEEDYRQALSLAPWDDLSQAGLDDMAIIRHFTDSAQPPGHESLQL